MSEVTIAMMPCTRFSRLARIPALCAAAWLAGCGGEGESSVTPPTDSNASPVIEMPTDPVEVTEGTTDVVYTPVASDADGDTLSFSVGGADAAQFVIDADTGRLRFANAPSFDQPSDANTDNDYGVTVTVADGNGGEDAADITVRVLQDPNALVYRARLFPDVFTRRDVEYAPGLFADIFFAPDNPDTAPPLLILASGGGFVVQDRTSVEPIARDFASRGYVTATIDYRVLQRLARNSDEVQIAATQAVHDMFAAVRSARAEDGFLSGIDVDSTTIIVGGESAGAVMAASLATLDPDDPISATAIASYLDANGGVYGNVGSHLDQSSVVQGAFALSGAIFDLGIIDPDSAPIYAAHEEFDRVVPCDTAAEGASGTATVVSGSCDIVPALQADAVPAELFLVEGSTGHVDYTDEQREVFYREAADFLFDAVIRDR